MPVTVLFLECKSYVIVGIYASVSGLLLMCGDVQFSGRPGKRNYIHFDSWSLRSLVTSDL